jgi:hypothetical protein
VTQPEAEEDEGLEGEGPTPRTDALSLLLLAATGFALGLSGTLGLLVGVALPAGGLAMGTFLRRRSYATLRALAPVPVVASLGFLTLATPTTPINELLAGAAGLAFLLWFSGEGGPRTRWTESAGALAFPALALGVAVVSSLLFPVTRDLLGLAAAIIVAELLFAAWLYAHPTDLADAGAALSRTPQE